MRAETNTNLVQVLELGHTLETEPLHFLLRYGERAALAARAMRAKAVHYKEGKEKTKVGTVAIGTTIDNRVIWAEAANQNLQPGENWTKLCGERGALRAMLMKSIGVVRVHGVWVSGGPWQPCAQTGFASTAFQTCGKCTDEYDQAGEITENTVFNHINPDFDAFEIVSKDELKALKSEASGYNLNFGYDKAFSNWRRAGTQTATLVPEFEHLPPAEGLRAALGVQALTGSLASI